MHVEAFNKQTFNQDGNGRAFSKRKNYNPPDWIYLHLLIKEKVKKIDVNRMRDGYIVDVLTSVDFQEILKIGRKVIQMYEGVIYRENFKISPSRKVIEKLFGLKQSYEDEGNDLMQGLNKLNMINVYGVQIPKDIEDFYKSESEQWMRTEYDDNVFNYWKLPNEKCIVKFKEGDVLDGDNDLKIDYLPI